jgi:hypothetical protein
MPCYIGVENSIIDVGMNTVMSSAIISGMNIVSMILMRKLDWIAM